MIPLCQVCVAFCHTRSQEPARIREDIYHRQVTVRAGGPDLGVFLKGYHPFAAQGGATLFDNTRVVDLGP